MLSGAVVHAEGRWLCELRRVTVLFAKLPAGDGQRNPHDVTKQTQDVMERLQRAAYRYEGSVNKVNVDEKGVTFLAVWGLPPLAHEDDPARAVNAAQMLQADLMADGLGACIGVATGNVYSGVLGNGRRAEYTVIGDAVNLAARLMEAANVCILCDGETQQVAQNEIEFKELPALTLKGKAKPVVVFQPTGRAVERVRHQIEIVGRALEREALATLLQGLLRQRESGVVVLEGGAGLGKTRLVQDTKEHAQQLGAEVLLGNALAIESATPYFAWRRALRQLFRLGDKPLHGEALREHVLAELLEDEADRLPLLNAVLGTNFVETPRSMELIGEVRADNLHGLICAVLRRRCAEAPQLLAFEDAHWIDAASWTLLKVVQRDVHPLAIILATRPMAERPKELDAIAQLPTTRWLTMTGLDAEQTLELVCQRLSCKRLPDVLGKLIQQKAEGNPFFSEQLAYALRDAGLLQIHDGICTLNADVGDLAKLSLPNTLQGIITSRIDRLSSQQQLALKVASVVGYEFPQQMVRDVYPVESERELVPKILPPLTALEIITDMRGDAETVYTFKHKITEEAVYNLMLFSQRRELHAATAEWYQRIYAEDLNPWLPLLAHHWQRAENWPKALEFADRAGQNAAVQFANAAAIRFYTQAIEIDSTQKLGTSDRTRSRWERRLAQAYFGMGQLDNCTEHATKALSLLGRPMPGSLPVLIGGLLLQVGLRTLQSLMPHRFVERDAKARELRLIAVRLFNRLSEIFIYKNNAVGCLYTGFREMNLAAPAGDSPELGRALVVMGIIIGAVPVRSVSRAWTTRALEIAGKTTEGNRAFILSRAAVHDLYIANWRDCEAWLAESIEISEALGDGRVREEAGAIQAKIWHYQGLFSQSAGGWAAVHELATLRNSEQTRSWGLLGQGENFVRMGRGVEAVALFERAMPWVKNTALETEVVWAKGMMSLACLRAGDLARARQLADETLKLVHWKRPVAYWMQQSIAAMCETYYELWQNAAPADKPALLKELKKAANGVRAFAGVFPFGIGFGHFWHAMALQACGKPSEALVSLQTCLSESTRLGLQFETGLAHRELARALPATSTEAAAHRAAARQILAGLNAVVDLQRVPADPA